MKNKSTMTVVCKKKVYEIDLEKLCLIISKLNKQEIKISELNKIKKLFKKYNLLNEDFLNNVNKI